MTDQLKTKQQSFNKTDVQKNQDKNIPGNKPNQNQNFQNENQKTGTNFQQNKEQNQVGKNKTNANQHKNK